MNAPTMQELRRWAVGQVSRDLPPHQRVAEAQRLAAQRAAALGVPR